MRIFVVLLLALASSFAQEEEKPKTLAEAKADFAKADKALNAAYVATKKAIPEYEFAELREEQRKWIEYRDARALAAVQYDYREIEEGKEKQSPHYWSWLADLSETRVQILEGWRGVGDPDSLSGFYIDGYGGHLSIVEKGGKLYFAINVVRGPTYHVGGIDGIAEVNQNLARFSDGGKDHDKKNETWLTFISKNRRLKVIGANTSYYHGVRAYFDGDYIRVKVMDDKTAAELMQADKAAE